MDEEEKKPNIAPADAQGDGVSTAAGAAEPSGAENAEDIFASLLDADQIAADFDRINFEIFGEPEKEFAPEPPEEETAEAEAEPAPAQQEAPKKPERKKAATSISFVLRPTTILIRSGIPCW